MRADRAVFERKLNEEARTMTTRMGRKLAELARARGRVMRASAAWLAAIRDGGRPARSRSAWASCSRRSGAPETDAFAVHQYGVAFMILSAALRLMRVDHLDTQAILFEVDATRRGRLRRGRGRRARRHGRRSRR